MKIVFESAEVIAVDKPGAWLSIPSRFGKKDSRPCVGIWLEETLNCRIWPVHRLDYEVSGLLLFAKTAEAHKTLNKWFEDGKIRKRYEAWTESNGLALVGKEEIWTSKLLRGKKRAYENENGKSAITHACCSGILPGKETLKWSLYPQTGRPHQLRYELAKRGFPILGDRLYGSKILYRENEIALRAVGIEFPEAVLGLPKNLTLSFEHKY